MESQGNEEETTHDSVNEDSRALVIALTQQLMLERDNGTPQITPQLAQSSAETARWPTTSMGNTGNFSVSDQIFLPPLSEDEREDPPLPEFLSDASVRAALHRANALRPQGHLSDEPQFPSALGGPPTRHLDVRVRADMTERDFLGGQDLDISQLSPYSPAFFILGLLYRGVLGISHAPKRRKVPVFQRVSSPEMKPSPC
jgi:hypothetical protein